MLPLIPIAMGPLIPIAMGLAEFIPSIAKLFGGKNAEDVANKVVGVAKAVTGLDDPAKAVEAIRADPALVLQFKANMAGIDLSKYLAELEDDKDRRKDIRESGALSRHVRPVIALTFHFFVWGVILFCDAGIIKAKLGISLFKWGTIEVSIGAAYFVIVLFYFMTKGLKDYFISKNPIG